MNFLHANNQYVPNSRKWLKTLDDMLFPQAEFLCISVSI